MNSQPWFLPYAKPNALNTILNDEQFFHETISPLFNNIKHPYSPHYGYKDIAGEANHNMLEGQPTYQKTHFSSEYINKNNMGQNNDIDKYGLIKNSQIKQANIGWIDNDTLKYTKNNYNPYQISSNFSVLPNNIKNFSNPHKIKGPLTQIVPWDTFKELNKKDDEYLNERNFQEILNHPFYQDMKSFLEQPFKHL